ncbi:MAG: Asp-tRNA(Asn)/Glu-tRNA(Gln) amidotransferase subunit GatA [Candidatus Pacebacteria bacterium]|nr:Asp-tRNA(Asn)/Glu-tRNA(Gln) amidotransferase subunit GatA [Candidatus Paceibacterota bacterium]
MNVKDFTIEKYHKGLLNKEFTVASFIEEIFNLIESEDSRLGAYLSLMKISALDEAKKADEVLAIRGADVLNSQPMFAVPMAIKDNILIKGHRATAGSKLLENYIASYDATVIRKLKSAGAIFLGKTNMDEFAMGSSTENSAYQKTRNPYDLERVPGGSSGGSAVAVAGHMALGSLGTDTGGSIRQPASLCGAVGLKPTYGAVSRFGAIALASSLDQIGPFAKTVKDVATIFKTISGIDKNDGTSQDIKYGEDLINPDFEKIKKLKIGIPKEYFNLEGMDEVTKQGINSVIDFYKKSGFEVKEVSLPNTKYALSCYYIILPAEASSNLARFDGIRYAKVGPSTPLGVNEIRSNAKNLLDLYVKNKTQGFGDEPKRRIILGTYVLSSGYYDAYYSKAQKVRSLVKKDFTDAFKEVDVILTPVSPTVAFKIGEKSADPLAMYLSDIFTIPVNLAGLPGISIPVKGINGLPVGFQLIGKSFREADILGLGQYYEKND